MRLSFRCATTVESRVFMRSVLCSVFEAVGLVAVVVGGFVVSVGVGLICAGVVVTVVAAFAEPTGD